VAVSPPAAPLEVLEQSPEGRVRAVCGDRRRGRGAHTRRGRPHRRGGRRGPGHGAGGRGHRPGAGTTPATGTRRRGGAGRARGTRPMVESGALPCAFVWGGDKGAVGGEHDEALPQHHHLVAEPEHLPPRHRQGEATKRPGDVIQAGGGGSEELPPPPPLSTHSNLPSSRGVEACPTVRITVHPGLPKQIGSASPP